MRVLQKFFTQSVCKELFELQRDGADPVADAERKPIFLLIDETQLFSSSRRRSKGMGDTADILNKMFETGRKRALDVFITTHRFSGSLHRSLFTNKNLTLVGAPTKPLATSRAIGMSAKAAMSSTRPAA